MDRREALKKSALGSLLLGLGKVLGGEKAEAKAAEPEAPELVDATEAGRTVCPSGNDTLWTCDVCGARTSTIFEQADGSKRCWFCTPAITIEALQTQDHKWEYSWSDDTPWYFAGYDPGMSIGTCSNVGSDLPGAPYSWNEASYTIGHPVGGIGEVAGDAISPECDLRGGETSRAQPPRLL